MQDSLLIVVPTFGAFDYAATAVRSAILNTHTLKPSVVIVDDASPGWNQSWADGLAEELGNVSFLRFNTNGGLTRSWNAGLTAAKTTGSRYAVVANSDVVFAPGWDRDIAKALGKYALVGPLTNAPGPCDRQYIGRYSICYNKKKGDDASHIALVQSEMHTNGANKYQECSLNGFCMVARTKTWWDNAFDKDNAFCPRNDFNSKGERNPTPLMTLNEDELQRRWRDRGLTAAACCGSYVFHYRAVTRGKNHLKGDWARKKEALQ